jgi:hypothetical protein
LAKGQYDITITEQNKKPVTKHVNLENNNIVQTVFVEERPGSVMEARAYSLAADAAVKIGYQPLEVADIRIKAAGIYQANGATAEARGELAKINSVPINERLLGGVPLLTGTVGKTASEDIDRLLMAHPEIQEKFPKKD